MASVKMKALKLALMTSRPLKVPTTRPTSRTMTRPSHGLNSAPSPELALGAMSQAPSRAARPNVPCSEMSNLPVSRINVSATTTIPSAEPPSATLIRLDDVKNTGLTTAPPIINTMITGTSVSSRKKLMASRRKPRRAIGRLAATGRSAVDSAIAELKRRHRVPPP